MQAAWRGRSGPAIVALPNVRPGIKTTLANTNILAVALWMAGALLSFSANALAVRELAGALGIFDILAFRYAGALVFLLVLAATVPSLRAQVRPRRPGLHLARNLVHFGATFCWSLAVTLLPLGVAFALEFTTPAWVALLAPLILGERLTRARLASVALGLAGVVVILRPGAEAVQPAALIMLTAALGFALATIATKALTGSQGTFTILLCMNVIQLPLALLGSTPSAWAGLGWGHLGPILALCAAGLSAHWCLTNAYRHGDATTVVPLDFLRIPFIAMIGWQFYGEPLDPMIFVGGGLIVLGIVLNLRAEARRRQATAPLGPVTSSR